MDPTIFVFSAREARTLVEDNPISATELVAIVGKRWIKWGMHKEERIPVLITIYCCAQCSASDIHTYTGIPVPGSLFMWWWVVEFVEWWVVKLCYLVSICYVIEYMWPVSLPEGTRQSTVKNILAPGTGTWYVFVVSMAIMSYENCGLNCSPMNQMEHSHVKKWLANKLMFQINQKKVCKNETGTRRTSSQSAMNGIDTMLLE